MKIEKIALFFFFVLIVAIPLIVSTQVITGYLLPKYIAWSVGLSISAVLLYKQLAKGSLQITLVEACAVSLLLFCIPSFLTALNFSESLYEVSKLFLLVVTFFFSAFIINKSRTKSIYYIALFAVIATVLTVVFSMKEFFEALRSDAAWADSVYLIEAFNGHKNLLSTWLLLLMPFTLIGIASAKKSLTILYWIALIFQLILIVILQTRAAYVGLLAGICLYLLISYFLKQKNPKAILMSGFYLVVILVGVSLLLILLTPVGKNLLSALELSSSSAQERIILWDKTIDIIKSNVFMGVGGGNWKIHFTKLGVEGLYRAELNNVVFRRPHNDLLWIWSEHGLFAVCSYLTWFFGAIYYGLKHIVNSGENKRVILICICGIVAYLSMSLFDFPKERVEHSIAISLMLALLFYYTKEQQAIVLRLPIPKSIILLLSAIFLVFFSYLGFSRYEAESLLKTTIAYKDAGNNRLMLEEVKKIDQTFMQIDDNAFPICWYEGVANFNLGAKEEAARNFDEAFQINPYNFNVLNNIATGEFIRGNYLKAEIYYLEALRVNPRFEGAKLNLISVYVNLGEWQKANYWLNSLTTKSQRTENFKRIIEQNLNS